MPGFGLFFSRAGIVGVLELGVPRAAE